MLQYLFFGTRIYLANFSFMWALPVISFAALLVFRLFWGGRQPCKGLLLVLPAAYVLVSVVTACLLAADSTAIIGLADLLFRLEPALLFAWLGLLAGTAVASLRPREEEQADA